ncbi:MAG: pyridine nucleotide-disulfide oxidoreductase [Robiginitomaculum sp.]|nr:MAG: pyridine nucleotide-disulfide oxidoreductase [Robiginitomaculum sp.]
MKPGVVIVGAGHGAGQVAFSLRQFGYDGAITLIGEENCAPYQRPPLSKAWLAGEAGLDEVLYKPEAFWKVHNITVITGRKVMEIDRANKTVRCDDDATMPYAHLVLATGGHARRMDCPGEGLPGVHVLRTLDDANGLNQAMQPGGRLVIIGGGYVGLEVAATASKRRLDVTVLEAESRVLARIAGADISTFFEQTHKAKGVNIITGVMALAFEGDEKLSGVRLADGTVIPADLALVGIGLIPNEALAREAGLVCENGIVVDDLCRTEDPYIFAIGDVTRHPNKIYGRSLRLESVHNALEQAKTAAGAIAGRKNPYNQVPWFWSDQYDIKLQIAGLSEGYEDTVLRGGTTQNSFAVFYFKDGGLIACDAVNAPAEYMAARIMIAKGVSPDRAMLVDLDVSMKEIMMQAQ